MHTEPTYAQAQRGQKTGNCITEGDDREMVIADAEAHYEQKANDERYDDGSIDTEVGAILVITNEETDEQTLEPITLRWGESDDYDPVREHGTLNKAQQGVR